MPCLFNVRPVMVMHTSLAIKHLAKLAGSDPLVFAGDFNFNPDSDCYKLAVQGGEERGGEGKPALASLLVASRFCKGCDLCTYFYIHRSCPEFATQHVVLTRVFCFRFSPRGRFFFVGRGFAREQWGLPGAARVGKGMVARNGS